MPRPYVRIMSVKIGIVPQCMRGLIYFDILSKFVHEDDWLGVTERKFLLCNPKVQSSMLTCGIPSIEKYFVHFFSFAIFRRVCSYMYFVKEKVLVQNLFFCLVCALNKQEIISLIKMVYFLTKISQNVVTKTIFFPYQNMLILLVVFKYGLCFEPIVKYLISIKKYITKHIPHTVQY